MDAPHEYAFLYGSPVPGYRAPDATVAPAARVTGMLLALIHDLDEGKYSIPPTRRHQTRTHDQFRRFASRPASSPSDEVILRGVTAWGGLLGAISLELFGHLHRAVTDYDAHFELVIARLDTRPLSSGQRRQRSAGSHFRPNEQPGTGLRQRYRAAAVSTEKVIVVRSSVSHSQLPDDSGCRGGSLTSD